MIGQLTLHAVGAPVPYSRDAARYGFTPDRNLAWRREVCAAFRLAAIGMRGCPEGHVEGVVVCIDFHGARKGSDLDNLSKEVLDALNRIAWADDRSIVELGPLRHLPRTPEGDRGATVTIEWLAPDDPRWVALQGRTPRKRRQGGTV